MNKTRRTQIDAIISQLEAIAEEIEVLKDAEEDAFYNLPDSLQYSEKGEAMEDAMTNLDDAFSYIEDAIDFLTEATN